MSITNTSLLDHSNYEKHQRILLEFVSDMYKLTDTEETAHIRVVQGKIIDAWDSSLVANRKRSATLWEKLELALAGTGVKMPESESQFIDMIVWAVATHKLMDRVTRTFKDQKVHYGVNLYIGEFEEYYEEDW